MELYLGLFLIILLLGIICERLVEFLKHILNESGFVSGSRARKYFNLRILRSKAYLSPLDDRQYAFQILKINLLCGFLIAWTFNLSAFDIFNPGTHVLNHIGWRGTTWLAVNYWFSDGNIFKGIAFLLGCLATGCLISFFSKVSHDVLGIFYYIKSDKRKLLTSPIRNPTPGASKSNAQSLFHIKLAFQEAKNKFMQIENIKVASLKIDNNGHYIELTGKAPFIDVPPSYLYTGTNEEQISIPIKTRTLRQDQKVRAHAADLSNQLFDVNDAADFGTMGCLVKGLGANSNNYFLLSCCHNFVHPITNYPVQLGSITAGSDAIADIGPTGQMIWDNDIDAALVPLSAAVLGQINNVVPQMGEPQGTIDFGTNDVNQNTVYVCGAKTQQLLSGTVTGILTDVKIDYEGTEATLFNLVVASNAGQAISQPGDSGACVLDSNNKVAGLIVAGTDTESYVIPINTILNKLGIQLI